MGVEPRHNQVKDREKKDLLPIASKELFPKAVSPQMVKLKLFKLGIFIKGLEERIQYRIGAEIDRVQVLVD